MLLQVEEIVDVESFRRVRKVGESKVQGKQDDNGYQVEPWQRLRPGDEYLEERIKRVQSMLGCVCPNREGTSKATRCKKAPIDRCQMSVRPSLFGRYRRPPASARPELASTYP